MLKKKLYGLFPALLLMLLIVSFSGRSIAQAGTQLPLVVLNGEDGESAGGGEWSSSSLNGRVSLILYVDPDKQGDVKELVSKLDSINYSKDKLNITFILNTAATIIPNFIIRNRLKKRAEEVPNTHYVLDFKKVLVKDWNLTDDDANVILIDADGNIVEQHKGEISKRIIREIVKKINMLIKKGEV
jgi:predicted transcriptional regulator